MRAARRFALSPRPNYPPQAPIFPAPVKHTTFVNDAHGAYDVLKEAMDLIPVEPLDLTEEDPAPDKPDAK
jgi:hypothetical protein